MTKLIFIAATFIMGTTVMSLSRLVNDFPAAINSVLPVALGFYFWVGSWIAIHAEAESHRKISTEHWGRFFIRGAIGTLIALGMQTITDNGAWTINPRLFWMYLFNIITLFGVLFDPLRNYFADVNLLYLGKESPIDRTFRKCPVAYYLIKLALFTYSSIILWMEF